MEQKIDTQQSDSDIQINSVTNYDNNKTLDASKNYFKPNKDKNVFRYDSTVVSPKGMNSKSILDISTPLNQKNNAIQSKVELAKFNTSIPVEESIGIQKHMSKKPAGKQPGLVKSSSYS